MDGVEVGQHTTKPALVDIEHTAAFGLFGNRLLSLLLGTDKEQRPSVSHQLLNKLISFVQASNRLLEINDMNTIAIHKDELLHLRVPATCLVTKMDTSFQ